jgi:raffinose/stachyose/melibiose transport system permease protein
MKTGDELMMTATYTLPKGFYLGNYMSALAISNIPRGFLNSIIVTMITLFCQVSLSCPAAFAIRKIRFRSSKRLLNFFLLGMMIPNFVCLIPMFSIYNALGLRDTYLSIILPQLGFSMPLCIYIYAGFFGFLPDDLLEAPVIDGCTTFQVFRHVVVPLSVNTTLTVVMFQFMFVWNEFTYANTFLFSRSMKTLPICLRDFAGEFGSVDWGPTFAAISMAVLPTLIVYFMLNKKIIEGVAAGAIKG